MAHGSFRPGDRVNLTQADIVLVDANPDSLKILVEMFAGFGVHEPHCCRSASEAQAFLANRVAHLVIVDAALPGVDGYQLVRWLRWSDSPELREVPVILLCGHTRASDIERARDCGANFVVRKPAVPLVLLQRIMWVSKETRDFVEAPGYRGPDRRVRAMGPPLGTRGRRQDDLSVDIGEAISPNMDQSEIDNLFQPKRAAL